MTNFWCDDEREAFRPLPWDCNIEDTEKTIPIDVLCKEINECLYKDQVLPYNSGITYDFEVLSKEENNDIIEDSDSECEHESYDAENSESSSETEDVYFCSEVGNNKFIYT